jgi:tetratricopeptide (TPR) repeat protein
MKIKKNSKTNKTTEWWQKKHFMHWAIFAFAFLLYANTIPNDYNMDDELVTVHHKLTSKGVSAIPEILTSPYYSDDMGYKYEYRPMVHVSFAIEHSLFGESAGVSHFINALLYALCCLFLFILLAKLFQGYSTFAFLITLVFAAHPIHTEVVASIKNRDEILGLLFSLLCWHTFLVASDKRSIPHIFLALFAFVASMLSKNSSFVFALIIPFSLIIFQKLKWYEPIIVSLLLTGIGVFFIDLTNNIDKLWIFVAIQSLPILWFFLMRLEFRQLVAGIINWTKQKAIQFGLTIQGKDVSESALQNLDLRNIKLTNPDYELHWNRTNIYRLIFVPVAVIAICIVYALTGFEIIIVASVIVFLTGFLTTKYEIKFAFFIAVNILFIVLLYLTNQRDLLAHAYSTILLIFFYQYLGKSYIYCVTVLIIWFVFLVANFNPASSGLIAILLIQFFRIKNVFYFLSVIVGFQISFLLYNIATQTVEVDEMARVIHATMLLLTFYRLKVGKNIFTLTPLVSFYALFIVVILCYTNGGLAVPKSPQNQFNRFIANVNSADLSIKPTRDDRPLDFVESSLTPSTPLEFKSGTALISVLHYGKMLLLPYPMSFYYGYKYVELTSVKSPWAVVSLLLHIALLFVAIFLIRKEPLISFSVIFYFLSLVPISNFLKPIAGTLADRLDMVPSIPFCILLVVVLLKIFKLPYNLSLDAIKANNGLKYSMLFILISYSAWTFARNLQWKDSLSLYTRDIQFVNNSAQAHNLLAHKLMEKSYEPGFETRGDVMRDSALMHFQASLNIYPKFFNVAYDIGRVYAIKNNSDSALFYFKYTSTLNDSFPTLYLNIAGIYQSMNSKTEANKYYASALKHDSLNASIYQQLLSNYLDGGLYRNAIDLCNIAEVKFPGNDGPVKIKAMAYYRLQIFDSSLYFFERSYQLNPNDGSVVASINDLKEKLKKRE